MKPALKSLIAKGYFPEELVPAFQTKSFGDKAALILSLLTNFKTKPTSKYCVYSIPKVRHHRRRLAITNPLHQLLLSDYIVKNWSQIEKSLKSSLSRSTPMVRVRSSRALTRKREYSSLSIERARCSLGSTYLLRTDVSRYYPTIYTHSIPWALHGKAYSKQNRGKGILGNDLDTLVRNTQDGQTIGIPIGPDTSLIIAELIASAMDAALAQNIVTSGIRYIDDYYLYFSSLSDAEQALAQVHATLREFELELNPSKTEITPVPEPLEAAWASELRLYPFRKTVRQQQTDIVAYFSRAYEHMSKYVNDYVLKYALTRVSVIPIKNANWTLYESMLLRSIVAEPSVLPIVTQIFTYYSNKKYPLDPKAIAKVISKVIIDNAELSQEHEVAWSLWLSKSLGIPLEEGAAKAISQMKNSIIALLALDMSNSGLIPKGLDVSLWRSLLKSESLYDEHWLLAYEATVKGWLNPKNGTRFITSDPFFSILTRENIQFYDPNRKLPTLKMQIKTSSSTKASSSRFPY